MSLPGSSARAPTRNRRWFWAIEHRLAARDPGGMRSRSRTGRWAGVFDMKASLIEAEFAMDALRKLGRQPPRPVVILITSDEEIGSPTSRRLI